MAEAVAGVLVAEQVVSGAIEGGVVAGYALRKSTLPLKAEFRCVNVGTKQDGEEPDSLARSAHTLSVVKGDYYIWGGLVADTVLASNDLHILCMANIAAGNLGAQYKAIPALGRSGSDVPGPRAGHSASVGGTSIYVYGGFDDATSPRALDEGGRVWVFDTESLRWRGVEPASGRAPPKYNHAAAMAGTRLVIHGGTTGGELTTDTWVFDTASSAWTELPPIRSDEMVPSATPCLAVVQDRVWIVGAAPDHGSVLQVYDLAANEAAPAADRAWTAVHFPGNPLVRSPGARSGGALAHVSAGLGRHYLVYMFGTKDGPEAKVEGQGEAADSTAASTDTSKDASKDAATPAMWSGLWALQLPSANASPAKVKDAARSALGLDSHALEWAAVELQADGGAAGEAAAPAASGKSHPGPRAYMGVCAVRGGGDGSTSGDGAGSGLGGLGSGLGLRLGVTGGGGLLGGGGGAGDSGGGDSVAMWGGLGPDGLRVGDGWVVRLYP